ncbi:hypothetical protein BB560_003092 [Smittium megazygosporum]|uniref:PWI domain-containing protein n=1 Tax=Smittium megazygosporum TaxID=133381 RepID=A0A2T9ZCZ4_9FUNG|nr:hypothetical protein BB560_003092 [Smittium megazygosporum]
MSGGFFKGTSLEQDSRFGDPQKKLLQKLKFSPILNEQVDIKKVNMTVMKPWVAKKVFETLGFDDDVVVEFVLSMLEEDKIDPKQMQINLTGFLESKTSAFMEELWKTLLSAQNGVQGIPREFIESKKQEMETKRIENEEIMRKVMEQKQLITGKSNAPNPSHSVESGHRDKYERRHRSDRDSRRFAEREKSPDRKYRERRKERSIRSRRYDDNSSDEREYRRRSGGERRKRHYSSRHESDASDSSDSKTRGRRSRDRDHRRRGDGEKDRNRDKHTESGSKSERNSNSRRSTSYDRDEKKDLDNRDKYRKSDSRSSRNSQKSPKKEKTDSLNEE